MDKSNRGGHVFNIPFTRMREGRRRRGELSREENFHFQLRYSERFDNFTGTVKYRRNSQEPTLATGFGFDG